MTFRHAQRRVKLQFTLNLHIEEQSKAELDQQEHTLLYISLGNRFIVSVPTCKK